jgi:hypothetical protein
MSRSCPGDQGRKGCIPDKGGRTSKINKIQWGAYEFACVFVVGSTKHFYEPDRGEKC